MSKSITTSTTTPSTSTPTITSIEELNKLGHVTKSSQIRYLHSLGHSRSSIATHLNIRYQHVRNVLITPIKKSS